MGRLQLFGGGDLGRPATGSTQLDRDVSLGEVETRVRALALAVKSEHVDSAYYVYGMGAQSRSIYKAFAATSGIRVIFHQSIIPPAFRWLSPIVASERGLLRIDESTCLERAFMKLIDGSMAGFFRIRRSLENEIIENARSLDTHRHYDLGVRASPDHVMYLVDGDNARSSTGAAEFISIGRDAPVALRNCLL
jgi:hypothetical protein